MMSSIGKFGRNEDGAITVDWVVLTAAVVGMAVAMILTIEGASGSVGDGVGDYLAARPVGQ